MLFRRITRRIAPPRPLPGLAIALARRRTVFGPVGLPDDPGVERSTVQGTTLRSSAANGLAPETALTITTPVYAAEVAA